MNLFSRACMTAFALAAVTLPLVLAPALAPLAEARDRNEGGSRNFSSRGISGGNMARDRSSGDREWKRRHGAGNDHGRDRYRRSHASNTDIRGGNISPNNRRWDRNWDRGDWNRANWNRASWERRAWERNAWRSDRHDIARDWSNRARPYYAGSVHPYYAGQQDRRERFSNNFYGGAISAYQDPGNGYYFYIDGYDDGMGDMAGGYPPSFRPGDQPSGNQAKVIIVSPETEAAACSFEQGVCVIRP